MITIELNKLKFPEKKFTLQFTMLTMSIQIFQYSINKDIYYDRKNVYF